VGSYDEMDTDRLTWLVLDRLIPIDEEAYARSALIGRDPELRSLVDQGVISEEQAIANLRARQLRYRDPDDAIIWIRQPLTVFLPVLFLLLLAAAVLF
jgi:hypothetical protein